MTPARAAVSLVEKGWAGSRQLAIRLNAHGVHVRHLVKGRLPREVAAIIRPYDGITIRGMSRSWFKLTAWLALWWAACRGAGDLVMVDNEKTARWLARWVPPLRERTVLIHEQADGSPRIVRTGAAVQLEPFLANGAG